MNEIKVNIDGRDIIGKAGMTVLEVAQTADIYIPTLCYYKGLTPYGGCRMCIVEIEKMRGLPTACTTPATDGMIVRTKTDQLQNMRRMVLEFLLTEHPNTCLTCDRKVRCENYHICLRKTSVTMGCVVCPKNKRCEFQKVVSYIGIDELHLPYSYKDLPIHREDPFFDRDYNMCILCGRCVRVCQEIRGASAIAFTSRGNMAIPGTAFGKSLEDSGCQFCGACVDACPTGALIDRRGKWQALPDKEVLTTCPYCGVGCELVLEVKRGKVIRSVPSLTGPANKGQACVKGRFGIVDFVHSKERLTTPLIRKNGKMEEASWDEAISLIATKLAGYKPGEVAVFSSAKCTNEENYVIQKFGRVALKTNNIDHCARLCHGPSVSGLAQSFGSGAMTNSIDEIANAGCVFAIGTNTTSTHPVIALEVIKAVKQNGAKLIVANPREIKLCKIADIWLQHKPGTDVALMMGMARVIVDEGLLDKAFIDERCENFDAFKESLKAFDIDTVSNITGVPKDKIIAAARMYATKRPSSLLYSMGITQHSHGTDNVLATSNLAMLTGNVGRPSTGVNPLRGQNNVQVSCDMGALPNVYSGYQKVDDPAVKQKFEAAWGPGLPDKIGLTVTEILDAAITKQIKALYLVGENPALSDPNKNHTDEALKALDFLVVQDVFASETAQFAHVILPAASFAEKDGTFTNTERRVQRVRQAIKPVGDSKADWWITCQIAQKMGAKGFEFKSAADIMSEVNKLTPSYAGITYERLEKQTLQWPCPSIDHPGTPTLHTKQFTRGKGKFMPLEYKPSKETPDKEYPFILTTERSLYQYHTGTLSRKVPGLNTLRKREQVEIHPKDATRLGINDGDLVTVTSRRGHVDAHAKISAASEPGVVTMSFHFAEAPTNFVTNSALDPVAKMPEFKVAAVRVEKRSN